MDYIINVLEYLSNILPLPFYVVMGGLLEEIVAPIPSPLIMTSAGSIAHSQNHTPIYVAIISLFAAAGKTVGALVIYYFADKAEDIVFSRFGKLLGITHKQVEGFGKRFNNTWTDDVLLIVLRAVPVFPGAPVAAVAGLIKLDIKTYIRSTFIGVWLRSMIFAYIGYYGMSRIGEKFQNAESVVDIIIVLAVVIFGIYFLYKNKDRLQKILLRRINND